MTTKKAVWLLTLLFGASVRAQMATTMSVPHWLGTKDGSTNAVFQKSFVSALPVLKAILLGACDGRSNIELNGQRAGEIAGPARASGVDVTRFLRQGTNELVVRVFGGGSP